MRLTAEEFQSLRDLKRSQDRRTAPHFLLEGWRALAEAVQADAPIEVVAYLPGTQTSTERAQLLLTMSQRGIPVRELSARDLKRISATEQAQGVVARIRKRITPIEILMRSDVSLIVALDGVSDPGNVGTVLRTCDWFGVTGVLLGKGCVDRYNDKVVRSTVGSLLHVPTVDDVDLKTTLRIAQGAGFHVVITAMDGTTDVGTLTPVSRMVVVLGSESHGVSPEVRALAQETVRVPRWGRIESLNVGVVCGIVLAQIRR